MRDERVLASKFFQRALCQREVAIDLISELAVVGPCQFDLPKGDLSPRSHSLCVVPEVSQGPDHLPDVQGSPQQPCPAPQVGATKGDSRVAAGSLSLVRQVLQDGGLGQASPCSQRVESSIEAVRGPEAEWLGLSHRYTVAQVVHSTRDEVTLVGAHKEGAGGSCSSNGDFGPGPP